MRKTKYSKFCEKIFGKYFSTKDKNEATENNLILEKATIPLEYHEYNAMVVMNIILTFFISLIISIILHLIVNNNISIWLILILPLIAVSLVAILYISLPNYLINKRALSIDRFLPYAINFISSMAVAGVSPSEIFQTLSTIKVYGEIQTEAKRIAKEINVMGIDNVTALKHSIELSPSKKFVSFLQGMIGTIQSGSDLNSYLENISEKFLEGDLIERKKHIEQLGVVAEAFVISVIAFPIFLVIILSVMGFFGGSMDFSIGVLFLFSFLILPLVYAAFYILVKSTTSENISKFSPEDGDIELNFFTEYKIELYIILFSLIFSAIFAGIIFIFTTQGTIESTLYLMLDVLFLIFIIMIAPISFYLFFKFKSKKDIQERFPEFLVEISDSLSSGMNTIDAIKTAEKGRYGKLNREIEKMKSQLSWNIALKEVFINFSNRVKSGIIQRIIVTVNEGLIMGGNTSKLFKAAAREVNQVNQIEHQRKANMSVYMSIILLCFFVFLAIILILDQTIFAQFLELQTKQAILTAGVINIQPVDPLLLKYGLFSFVYVQVIGSGLLAGYMMDGKLASGARFAVILAIISFIVFKVLF